MKLTPIEKEVLQTIQRFYPNSWDEVLVVYEITKSFDNAIKTLALSNATGELPQITANLFV